jgi:MFS family permease
MLKIAHNYVLLKAGKLPHLHGLWGVYLNELFRRISTSMVGLFIPIYIWQQTGEFSLAALYYFIYALTAFFLQFPGALLIKKIGVDWSMVIGSFFRAIFLFSLIFAQYNHIFFWISALFFGLCQPFDWLPYHYCLSKLSQKKQNFSKAASFSQIITYTGATLGPIIGGVIIQLFGFTTLYMVSGSMIIIAAIMPFLDEFEKKDMHITGKDIIKRLTDPGIKKHLLASFLQYSDGLANMLIWPFFLFTALKSYEGAGLLQTVSLTVGVGVMFLAGKLLKKKKYFIMYLGSFLIIIGWLGRLLSGSILGLTISNILCLSGTTFLWMPYMTLLYAKSVEKKYTMEFWLIREILGYGFYAMATFLIFIALKLNISISTLVYINIFLVLFTLTLPKLFKEYILMMKNGKS